MALVSLKLHTRAHTQWSYSVLNFVETSKEVSIGFIFVLDHSGFFIRLYF